MKAQRLRLTFARGEPLRFISHLDLTRFWERALKRAGVIVAYSEGFSPHPQIALGAPLPVGTTGEAELMDIYLAEPLEPEELRRRLAPQLPPGVSISAAEEIPLDWPSLQSQLRAADWRVTLAAGCERSDVEQRVAALLARESIPWEQQREKEVRRYDLRPLIESLKVGDGEEPVTLRMRLRAEPSATGRADQVVAALGLPPALHAHRLALHLASAEEATQAAATVP